jgi:hypothetical protein
MQHVRLISHTSLGRGALFLLHPLTSSLYACTILNSTAGDEAASSDGVTLGGSKLSKAPAKRTSGIKNSGTRTVNLSNADRRAAEYPKEFRVDAGKLFCFHCSKEVNEESTSVKRHRGSDSHQANVQVSAARQAKNLRLGNVVTQWFADSRAKGETLSVADKLWRLRVLQTAMSAGTPLAQIDTWAALLSESGRRVPRASNLAQLIPLALYCEMEKIKEQVAGQQVSVVFDGTTSECEVIAVVVRYADMHGFI